MKESLLTLGLVLVLIGCGDTTDTTEEEPTTDEETEVVTEEEDTEEELVDNDEEEMEKELTVIADDLMIPWSIEKDEDTFYISEREGTIVQIMDNEVTRQEVELEQPLSNAQEAGLLGFILHPMNEENIEAFGYYTYEGASGPTNRVVRLQLEEDVWSEVEIFLDDIPSGNVHHGGRLAIGPDDLLYITTGDAAIPDLAQDIESLAGRILRMDLEGNIPKDNPDPDSYVYSYGHRNPQGITWLEDGTMYASEHGNQALDEVNQIEAGNNYGWPVIEGDEEQEGMLSPNYHSGFDNTWAPSGMSSYEDRLYISALRGNAILEINLDTDEVNELLSDHGRIRDVYIKEEFLYFITNNTDGRGSPNSGDDHLYRIHLEELN